MARDSSGTKNQPQYAGTGAPSDAADLSEVANYAAAVGNRKSGTNSVRLGLTGADVWDGLEFYETDTKLLYVYASTTWLLFTALVPPIARVSRAGAFSTSATGGTYLALPWDTDVVNVGGTHSTSSNPTRFTATVPGYYRIRGNARINTTSASGNAQIAKNGTAISDTLYAIQPISGANPFVVCEDTVLMATNDYLEFMVASSAASIAVSQAACSFVFLHP
jgi:hypothetical protein